MERQGVIDVGSSAVKYAVYELGGERPSLVFEGDPVATSLGRGLEPGGLLSPVAREASLKTLTDFVHEIHDLDAEPKLCLATEAVRKAKDGPEFTAAMAGILGPGCRVECIDAETEARWAYLSARHAVGPLPAATLIIDPGGSSNDLAFAPRDEAEWFHTLPFGMNHLMALVPPEENDARLDEAQMRRLLDDLKRRYSGLRRQIAGLHEPPRCLVATSGAIIALAAVDLALTDPSRDSRARAVTGHELSLDAVRGVARELAPLAAPERRPVDATRGRGKDPRPLRREGRSHQLPGGVHKADHRLAGVHEGGLRPGW